MFLQIADPVLPIVDDAGDEDGVGVPLLHRSHEVVRRAGTSACNHRYSDRVGDSSREL